MYCNYKDTVNHKGSVHTVYGIFWVPLLSSSLLYFTDRVANKTFVWKWLIFRHCHQHIPKTNPFLSPSNDVQVNWQFLSLKSTETRSALSRRERSANFIFFTPSHRLNGLSVTLKVSPFTMICNRCVTIQVFDPTITILVMIPSQI